MEQENVNRHMSTFFYTENQQRSKDIFSETHLVLPHFDILRWVFSYRPTREPRQESQGRHRHVPTKGPSVLPALEGRHT